MKHTIICLNYMLYPFYMYKAIGVILRFDILRLYNVYVKGGQKETHNQDPGFNQEGDLCNAGAFHT